MSLSEKLAEYRRKHPGSSVSDFLASAPHDAEIENRRLTGSFWTPRHRVELAHARLEADLGPRWREDFTVWDPACGPGTLTRGYLFSDLYLSTLRRDELSLTSDQSATTFQHDFLNADSSEIPAELLRGHSPLLILANPPYGQASEYTGATKTQIAHSATAQRMRQLKLGHASAELYTQFYFRCVEIARLIPRREVHIAFFSKTGMLTSSAYGAFRQLFRQHFGFESGFLFNASEFTGASATWGVMFAHWSTTSTENPRFAQWAPRAVDKRESLNAWLAEIAVGKEKDELAPLTTNGFLPAGPKAPLVMNKGWLGYVHSNGNNLQYSARHVGIYSMGFGSAHGREITEENFERAAVVFSVRRAVYRCAGAQAWIQDKEEFRHPEHLSTEFLNDCVIFSLFDSQSHQTAHEKWVFRGREYRIVNHFFPFPGPQERFVYRWLRGRELSPQAQAVLDLARELYHEAKPQPWDAGWCQVHRLAFGAQRPNDQLLCYRKDWRARVQTLAQKIANYAYEDGMFTPPTSA